ncbi:MAG: hypothetical protein WC860_07050 [Candidatus Margulisiibacteriota bacterium]
MDNLDKDEEIKKDKIQKKFNTLKALTTTSKRSNKPTDEELLQKATQIIEENDARNETEIESLFRDKYEKKEAKKLLNKYLHDYTIETVSDKHTLSQLIYLEIINLRLQKALNECQKETNAIPGNLVDLIHKNIKEITALKTTLGINKSKKEDKEDGYSYMQLIIKKYKQWLLENSMSRTIQCPHCVKPILLKMKTEHWESLKHPFIKDRIFFNPTLVELFIKQEPVTKEALAKIFDASPDFIDWIIEKYKMKHKQENVVNEKENTKNVQEQVN